MAGNQLSIGIITVHQPINSSLSLHSPPPDVLNQPNLSPNYLNAIGLLRTSWKNKWGKLISITYGTAVAVNARTLLTCSHNFYSVKNKRCSEIEFVPGITAGRIGPFWKIYKVSNVQNFAYSQLQPIFTHQPLKQQIAMVILQEELDLDHFMPVGSLQNLDIDQPLQIVGYPSKNFSATVELAEAQACRNLLQGRFLKVNDSIIHHSMPTEPGHSGSPIIAFRQNGLPYIVGIHTHRGHDPSYNSGVYFNTENLKTLSKYEEKLCSVTKCQGINFFKNNANFSFYQRAQYEQKQQQDYNYACNLLQVYDEVHQFDQWSRRSVLQANLVPQLESDFTEQASIDRDLIQSNFDGGIVISQSNLSEVPQNIVNTNDISPQQEPPGPRDRRIQL